MIAASPTINVIKAPSAVKTTTDYAVVFLTALGPKHTFGNNHWSTVTSKRYPLGHQYWTYYHWALD
jgi:hypothetical protein